MLFGIGDIVAGVGGRRDGQQSAPAQIAFVATIVGAVLSAIYVFGFASDSVGNLSRSDFLWASAAGVIMSAARPLLYKGMSVGPIVVFSPVVALTSVVTPAILAPLVGQSLARLEILGVIIALPAVVMVSSQGRLPTFEELAKSSVAGLGVVVGLCVGLGGLFLSFVSEDAEASPAVFLTVLGIIVIPAVSRVLGQSVIPNRTTIGWGAMVGTTSVVAFVLSAIMFQRGNAAIGSALISLSPGISIAIAWRFLGEKLWPLQMLGGVLGAFAVFLFAIA